MPKHVAFIIKTQYNHNNCYTKLLLLDGKLQKLSLVHTLCPVLCIILTLLSACVCKVPEVMSCAFKCVLMPMCIIAAYQPLKLMKVVTAKVNEVCLRYGDNGKLATLPQPSPGPPISSCAIKNTRRRMEDRHVIIEDFHTVFGIQVLHKHIF
jgi:hypothetical protein